MSIITIGNFQLIGRPRSSNKQNMPCAGACARSAYSMREIFVLAHRDRNGEAQDGAERNLLTWMGFERSDEAVKFVLCRPPALLEQQIVLQKPQNAVRLTFR
jgi:hypothetical protein